MTNLKINALSCEQYYPMSLGNGRDCVLVDYVGSNFLSLNPHTHNVPYEGSPCGWYKMANLTKEDTQYPVVMAGIQIMQFGAPAEPTFYEQEFIPEKAQLVTVLDFRFGLKLKITSFMTKDSVWCERAEVLEVPQDQEYGFAYRVNEPFFASGCYYGDFEYPRDFEFSYGENELSFDYKIGNHSGKGVLIANKSFVEVKKREDREWNNPKNIEGYFETLKEGDVIERAMICLGDNEKYIAFEDLYKKASLGLAALEKEHIAEWEEYFATSDICLPDQKLSYIYKVSRYIAKSYQNTETGLIALGMLPNHWKGATWCSWDAEFAHEALLSCGNFKESSLYADSYVKTAPQNYEAVKKCGFPGVAFSGWTTVLGEFIGHTSLEEWIMNFKPLFCAYAVIALYNEWSINPDAITDEHKKIAEDVLKFWLAKIIEEKNGLYYVIDMKDSAEMEITVSLDSKIQSTIGKSFLYTAKMTGNQKYKEIGEKLFEALEENRRPDGIMADWKGSPYCDFLIWTYRFLSEDNFITPKELDKLMQTLNTPWGYDINAASEEYRHWPWYVSVSVINYILSKNPQKAMENIKKLAMYSSPLGAFPEKVRLDGYKVNYWYCSPHALSVSAVNASFAYSVKDDTLILLGGFTRDYGDFSCRDLRVRGGYAVSIKVKKGKIVSLKIKNENSLKKRVVLELNPQFKLPKKYKEIEIEANCEFVYNK